MYRHVNNLTFIRFLQSGRVNFWEAAGLSKLFSESHKGAILVSTHCDFKKSLFYPGTAVAEHQPFLSAMQCSNDGGSIIKRAYVIELHVRFRC